MLLFGIRAHKQMRERKKTTNLAQNIAHYPRKKDVEMTLTAANLRAKQRRRENCARTSACGEKLQPAKTREELKNRPRISDCVCVCMRVRNWCVKITFSVTSAKRTYPSERKVMFPCTFFYVLLVDDC